MDTTQRKEFDNQYYNHQEAMKEIRELKGMVSEIRDSLEDLEELKTNVKEIVERYVDEINILKTELSTKN